MKPMVLRLKLPQTLIVTLVEFQAQNEKENLCVPVVFPVLSVVKLTVLIMMKKKIGPNMSA